MFYNNIYQYFALEGVYLAVSQRSANFTDSCHGGDLVDYNEIKLYCYVFVMWRNKLVYNNFVSLMTYFLLKIVFIIQPVSENQLLDLCWRSWCDVTYKTLFEDGTDSHILRNQVMKTMEREKNLLINEIKEFITLFQHFHI